MDVLMDVVVGVCLVGLALLLFSGAAWVTVQVMCAAIGAWLDRPRGDRVRRRR